jgi:hypothetical protein
MGKLPNLVNDSESQLVNSQDIARNHQASAAFVQKVYTRLYIFVGAILLGHYLTIEQRTD